MARPYPKNRRLRLPDILEFAQLCAYAASGRSLCERRPAAARGPIDRGLLPAPEGQSRPFCQGVATKGKVTKLAWRGAW
jgi:hypothetical protein